MMMVIKAQYQLILLLLATLLLRSSGALSNKDASSAVPDRELGTRVVYKWQSHPGWNMVPSRSEMVPKTTKTKPYSRPKRKNVFNTSEMSKTMMSTKKSKSMSKKHDSSMSYKKRQRYHKGKPKMFYPGPSKGKGKGTVRPPPRPTRPPPRPTRRPPYRKPTPSPEISTDFSLATVDNPLVLFALAETGTEVVVDLSLPNNNRVDELYIVRDENVVPGSNCPPVGGSLVPINRQRRTASVPLNGIDSVVALCVGGVVVAQSYYVFEAQADVGGGDEVSVLVMYFLLYFDSLQRHGFNLF